jgi:hypothetical protein
VSNNPLGLPDEAIVKAPSALRQLTLRQLLGAGAVPHVVHALQGPAWGPLDGQSVALRALSTDEQERCVADALKWLTEGAKLQRADVYTETGEQTLAVEYQVQVLARALVMPADPRKPMVEGAADVRELLSPEQVAWLFEQYTAFQATRSPYQKLTPEGVEEVATALGKGFLPPTSLSSFDAATLRSIVTALALRLSTLTTAPSSLTPSPSA